MAFVWTNELKETLAIQVESRVMLWDKSHKLYKRADISSRHWKEIGDELGCSGVQAEHQFKLLKRRYVRMKEAQKNTEQSGSAAVASCLEFLDRTLVRRRAFDSIPHMPLLSSPAIEAAPMLPVPSASPMPSSSDSTMLPSPVAEDPVPPNIFVPTPESSSNDMEYILPTRSIRRRELQASRVRVNREYERTSTLLKISEAADTIAESFRTNPTPSRCLEIPIIANPACQNLIHLISTNMTDLTNEEAKRISDAIIIIYADILAKRSANQ